MFSNRGSGLYSVSILRSGYSPCLAIGGLDCILYQLSGVGTPHILHQGLWTVLMYSVQLSGVGIVLFFLLVFSSAMTVVTGNACP